MCRKIMPTMYLLIFLMLSIGIHFVFPGKKIIHFPYTLSGILFIIFGAVLNIRADNLFKKSSTTVKPHEEPTSLEVTGPFRLSRHPMYLGMAAIILGAAVILGSLIPFVFPLLFVILMEALFITTEEENLKQAFGEKYLDYKKKVRRWI
ncbi:MAG: isoprenylcysteine carboxylmethyltransferase family protein [Candidatus Aminicenantes bacterium]|nr:isoprenylcysteine carboxylmethyltransferase family protein [Candidatus Aminicenantes bacterium]